MTIQEKAKIIKRISWTETLRAMNVGQIVNAELIDRINIVRHITRISKLENKKFSTKKISETKIVENPMYVDPLTQKRFDP